MSGKEIISDIECLVEEWKEEWNRLKQSVEPVVLVGGGATSSFVLGEFRANGIYPVCFCDNSKEKQGKQIDDLLILSIEEAKKTYKSCIFYITTQLYYSQIRKQLLDIGIPAERIIQYDLICQFEWEKNYLQFIYEHENELSKLIDAVADKKSKKVIAARLKFLVTRKRDFVCAIRDNVQYFDESIIDYKSINAFIDIGLYTGDTVLNFEKYGDMDKCTIFGFEFDDGLFKQSQENLKHLGDRVKLIKKAVSDTDGHLLVTSMLGEMQSIVNIFNDNNETGKDVETCKLDSELNGNISNAFLKMDIEGAEISALKGAEAFIKNNRPILAICIYHKAEDILDIPRIIEEYYKGYIFYIRHYSDNQTETVLYALPT